MSMTPKELIKEVYEIAFGEDAYLRGFFPEEVVARLQEFSDGSNPILIEEAWNEAEELNTSLRELSDADLVDCRQALIDRTNRIMQALNEIGTEEQSPLNCTIIEYIIIMELTEQESLQWDANRIMEQIQMAESRHMQMGALCSYLLQYPDMTIRDFFAMASKELEEQEEELGYYD